MTLSFVFGLIALAGIIFTTVQALLTRRFRKTRALPARHTDFVSILKPVCGLDDELEENLLSFVALRGIGYEVIVSAEDESDPALAVVERVMRAHPEAPFRVVIDAGSREGVVNRKVERLIAAARAARGEILFISDSNVRVEAEDFAKTLSAFDDRTVGCVSNLFTGSGARTTGAVLESLHLLGFVVPGAVLAAAAGVPCVVGKSMAISRRALSAIGGFERFRRVLAEDQAIGIAVKRAGYEIVLSPVVVRNVVVQRSIGRAVDRQVRWNKIRYAFSRPLYAGELLLNPLVFALLAWACAPTAFAAFPLLIVLARYLQFALLARATRSGMTWVQLAAVPLLDVAMFYAWLIPFVSNSVTWRGYEARIGRGTELLEQA
ncbi:MAG TPA: glycosyltransferase [Thermoanaerobaculia bacterium]|nr:glycosyltransferase [Thermoanaerobaculia bacterium]